MAEMPSTDADLDRLPTDQDFGRLQLTTLFYYLHETNPDNWLVRDKTEPTAPVSIAAVGMALATVPVNVERGIILREFAAPHWFAVEHHAALSAGRCRFTARRLYRRLVMTWGNPLMRAVWFK